MSEVIGSVFSVIWFLMIFVILKNVAEKKKRTGGGTAAGKAPAKAPPRKTEDPEAGIYKGPSPVKGSYESDFDQIERQGSPKPQKLKAGEARPARSFLKDTSALGEFMVEDRHNDWLARQIREEKKHVVWNNFVDLGAAHDEACAAELNRRDHHRKHQSYVVDDGITDN